MRLFFSYLRSWRKGFIIFNAILIIFAVVLVLYKVPYKAIIYPILLSLFIGIIYIIYNLLAERRRHESLCCIKGMTASMISEMPEPETVAEADYQQIIELLKNEVIRLEANGEAKYKDMIDYYTVWVHQIKTPISSMRLTLQSEDSPIFYKLSSELMRIEQYVEMVLTFLRLNSNSSDYVFKEHNIDDIIRRSVRKFATDFIGKNIRFEYEPIERTVVTDEKWLAFVIEQVLSNSLKYTKKGSVRIYMGKPETLCIEDTGIGIAAQDLPRIFENGYTGLNGRVDKTASGLGLYLCKKICNNLGIDIYAESEIGVGTKIYIDLSQYSFRKE